MRYVLTNAQMRAADGFTINELKVPSLTLMERAGAALAAEAERMCPAGGDVLCVCGGGNNGGDGRKSRNGLEYGGRRRFKSGYGKKAHRFYVRRRT